MGELIINRVHSGGLDGRSTEDVREMLVPELGAELAGRVAGNLADFDVLVTRDRETIAELSRNVEGLTPILVPHLDEEVQDLLGLSKIAEHLLG